MTVTAPLQYEASKSLKRTSSNAGFHDSSPSKPRRLQTHRHFLHHKSKTSIDQTFAFQNYAHSTELLDRSIALALEAVGFHAVEPLALESFRALTEEYMAHVLSSVRRSMHICRRTQSNPQDYLYALRTHQLSLRALKPHLDPPVAPEKSIISLEPDTLGKEDAFPAPELDGRFDDHGPQRPAHLPKHFPHLPGSHTYKSTSRYVSRESDPGKIRERATEEGRLGEAALQKFVGSGLQSGHGGVPELSTSSAPTLHDRRFAVWKEAMTTDEDDDASNVIDILIGDVNGESQRGPPLGRVHFGPIVNADQFYLRKPLPAKRPNRGADASAAMIK